MKPTECCLKCPHVVRGGVWTCGKSGKPCGWHWANGQCYTRCIPDTIPDDYDPKRDFHKDGCNCGGLADTTEA